MEEILRAIEIWANSPSTFLVSSNTYQQGFEDGERVAKRTVTAIINQLKLEKNIKKDEYENPKNRF